MGSPPPADDRLPDPPAARRGVGGPGSGGSRSPAAGRLLASIAVVAVIALVALGFSGGFRGSGSPATSAAADAVASDAATALAGSQSPAGSDDPGVASSDPGAAASPDAGAPSPEASSDPAAPAVDADVAIVPVTSFRTGRSTALASDVRGIATGDSPFASLVLVKTDADAVLGALGIDGARLGGKLVKVASADALATALAKHRTWLGFLRADQVGPGVRALAWGDAALFGEGRVASLDAWPLHATLPVAGGRSAYSPSKAWTVFAAGDIGLDRGVALMVKQHGNNVNYPYDGGTVKITGRCKDCSPMGWDLPYPKRTGNAGAMRSLIKNADLAVANLETVAVTNWTYHEHGTTFTGNPALLPGLKNAGFDWVSMGNNHVGDGGPKGILQSMGYLDKLGIRHGGAGANPAAAHKPSILNVGGVKVAMLGYDTIAGVYNATNSKAGSARMTAAWVRRDVKAARAAGAQVVIVYPHWGVENTTGPTAVQTALGHAAIDAGADLVIGNHPHWAGSMEVYKGRPIWYALGNFAFDQTWSEPTMEGITLELTFSGTKLVQAWMHPHLVLDFAQPNLMDPLGSGKVVLDQVFKGSRNLPW